ncbi:MAG: hypothetical protein EBS29_11590 [Chloroflexia bacterium]|nr:hypothetical protein [Chloroflexia bacterium]
MTYDNDGDASDPLFDNLPAGLRFDTWVNDDELWLLCCDILRGEGNGVCATNNVSNMSELEIQTHSEHDIFVDCQNHCHSYTPPIITV